MISDKIRYIIHNFDDKKNISQYTNQDNSKLPRLEPHGEDWILIENWECEFDGIVYIVPKGFVTDGASIPRFLWSICGTPMEPPRVLAAVLHDYLYDIGPMEPEDQWKRLRKEADIIYKNYNIQLGMAKWKASIEYSALRMFGWIHWGRKEDENQNSTDK